VAAQLILDGKVEVVVSESMSIASKSVLRPLRAKGPCAGGIAGVRAALTNVVIEFLRLRGEARLAGSDLVLVAGAEVVVVVVVGGMSGRVAVGDMAVATVAVVADDRLSKGVVGAFGAVKSFMPVAGAMPVVALVELDRGTSNGLVGVTRSILEARIDLGSVMGVVVMVAALAPPLATGRAGKVCEA